MMNLYLIYISTVISSYIFNTYNYIKNRINVEKIKKRKLIFKKNLCSDAERTVKQADMVPTIYYLKASLTSFVPIYNLFSPEKYRNVYYTADLDGLSEEYYNIANEQEIIQRYANGVAIKVLQELGLDIPKEFEVVENKIDSFDIDEKVVNDINKTINSLLSFSNEKNYSVDNINPISNKEYKKREKIIKRLNKDKKLVLDFKE
jgi:hypothetical protein